MNTPYNGTNIRVDRQTEAGRVVEFIGIIDDVAGKKIGHYGPLLREYYRSDVDE
jgi:hypothetical protein